MVFHAQGGSREVRGRKGAVQGSQMDPLNGPIAGLVEGDTFFGTHFSGGSTRKMGPRRCVFASSWGIDDSTISVTRMSSRLGPEIFFLQRVFRAQVASLIRHRYHAKRRTVPVRGRPLVLYSQQIVDALGSPNSTPATF